MSIAIKEVETLLNSLEQVKESENTYRKLMSQYDKDLSDIYHQIECGTFNAAQGYKKLMDLKGLLLERRKVKNEHFFLQSLTTSFNIEKTISDFKSIKTKLDKKYQNALGGFVEQE